MADKKQKYEVVRPWAGVSVGEVLELDAVHPALAPNLRKVGAGVAATGDGSDLIAAAKAQAKEIVEAAKEAAAKVKADASKEATEIVEAAKKAAPPPPPTK